MANHECERLMLPAELALAYPKFDPLGIENARSRQIVDF